MKTKLFFPVLIVALILVLTGCSLAQPERTASQGRLVGVFITLEPLDLTDPDDFSLSVSASGQLVLDEPEPRVLEAELADREDQLEDGQILRSREYRFPAEYPGYGFFAPTIPAQGDSESYIACTSDSVIADGNTHISESDQGTDLELEGSVYAAVGSGHITLYYNPVYQREDGSVYAVTGSGISTGTDIAGQQFSQTLRDTATHTINGETASQYTSVTLSLEVIEAPSLIRVLQMDRNHMLLHESELSVDQMPDTLALLPETDYVICESINPAGGESTPSGRSLYTFGDEAIRCFVPTQEGLCIPKDTQLQWFNQ